VGGWFGKFSCLPLIVIIVLLIFFISCQEMKKKNFFSVFLISLTRMTMKYLSLLLHEEFEEFSHKNKVGCCLMIFDIHSLLLYMAGLGGDGCDGRGG
jgi:hypothetical protein